MDLQGSLDNMLEGKTVKKFKLKIETCNEKTRIEGDPECSSEEEIEEWMVNKYIWINALD